MKTYTKGPLSLLLLYLMSVIIATFSASLSVGLAVFCLA